MNHMEKFDHMATQLPKEELAFTPAALLGHARHTLHFHERASYLCTPGCGKPFADIQSTRRYQAQCKSHLGTI